MGVAIFSEEAWAESWDRRSALIEHLTPVLLGALAPVPGERIVDVGTGLAPIGIAAARAVEPSGTVHAVDISAPILGRARSRAAKAGVSNLHFHELDAETAAIPGAPFDAAASLLGVMFFADPVAAFSNIRQHLVPGGRVAFLAWAEPAANPLLAEVLLDGFADGGLVHADRDSFSLSRGSRFTAVVEAAGFQSVQIARRELVARVSAPAVFDELLFDVYRVADERRPAARLHVQEAMRASVTSRGIMVPLAVHVATARNGRSRLEG